MRHGAAGAIAWLPTLLRGRPKSRNDLIRQPRSQQAKELWLLIVDASASTKRHQALSQAKGLLAQVFDDAYRRRVRLALLTANGNAPRWQHQGLKASRALMPWLDELGAGGGTPLMVAFEQAGEWLEQRRRKHPSEQQRVLVMTDGRVKAMPSDSPFNCPGLLIDIESGPIRLRKAEQMAAKLGLEYQHIEGLRPS
ncbi:vWA domain-containing protein [Pseudomonas syringae]|uniref:Magnesium chelatase n=1 Tax=Pseudomonas syringae TaxID=317 RepID=A0A085VNF5_PSESX|nr:VWA domain-containing protein [Pseudomonas syringae]KFE56968.1 magnesium chelatase [Pseudomonas syringae]